MSLCFTPVLFLHAHNIFWYPLGLSAGWITTVLFLNLAAVLGKCWWDCYGVNLPESKIWVQNISLNFPFICSPICLCLLNAFFFAGTFSKSSLITMWCLPEPMKDPFNTCLLNLLQTYWTSQTGVNHIITDCTACRIMPWEQRWQFLNCEITQESWECTVCLMWCAQKTSESDSEAHKGL